MTTFLISLLFGCVGAVTANSRGRSAFLWFLLCMLFGWLALLALFIMPRFLKEPVPDPSVVEVMTVPPPVVSKEPPQSDWYYLNKEKIVCGPLSAASVRDKWVERILSPATWVWHESMFEWKQISKEPLLLEWLQKKETTSST